jgi:hypothetical protein
MQNREVGHRSVVDAITRWSEWSCDLSVVLIRGQQRDAAVHGAIHPDSSYQPSPTVVVGRASTVPALKRDSLLSLSPLLNRIRTKGVCEYGYKT